MLQDPNLPWYKKLAKSANSWPGTIVIGLILMMFLVQSFIIPSGSMIKTLRIGDMLIVNKYAYGLLAPHIPWLEWSPVPGVDLINNPQSGHLIDGKKPQRGDIVVFRYPRTPKVHYVKRCVATQGDLLFIKNKDLYLHINENDDFIKTYFPNVKTVMINGKLWIINPHMSNHSGIWHDPKVTKISQTIPAQTVIYKNPTNGEQDLIRVDDKDLFVNFSYLDDAQLFRKYKKHDIREYLERKWVKNPKGYPLNLKGLMEKLQTMNLGDDIDFTSSDYPLNKEIFDFASAEAPFEVSKDNYFMMGDNRDHSNDSRFWGTVHYGLVEGTPLFVFFSIADDYSIRWERVGKSMAQLEGLVK